MELSWEKVSAQLQPATAGHARLVLSKMVLYFCTSLYVCRAQGEKAAMLSRAVREDHEFKISRMIVDIFNYENIVKVSKIRIIDSRSSLRLLEGKIANDFFCGPILLSLLLRSVIFWGRKCVKNMLFYSAHRAVSPHCLARLTQLLPHKFTPLNTWFLNASQSNF